MQNPLNFLRSVKQEIFKITWPTSKEALMGTVMVIAMAVVASLFFLLLDQFFKVGLNYLIGAETQHDEMVHCSILFWI